MPKSLQNCVRIQRYEIPKANLGKTYNMTYVPLNIFLKGEKEKCK